MSDHTDDPYHTDLVDPFVEPAVPPRRIVIGISGASGIAYGVRALQIGRSLGYETHLVVSRAAEMTRAHETAMSSREMHALADASYKVADVGAAIASGSFHTEGMLIAPCSSRTLGAVANGISDNLLVRAAEVTLKERRRLVLMVRETPLTSTHLRAMSAVTEMGGVVMPPVPAFYTAPDDLDDMVTQSVARAFDLFGNPVPDIPRWGQTSYVSPRADLAAPHEAGSRTGESGPR